MIKSIKFPPNALVIIKSNKTADAFYIIKQGNVKVRYEIPLENNQKEELLAPGKFFGVVSALSEYPYIEDVISVNKVELVMINKDDFLALIQKNFEIAIKIVRYLSIKLRVINGLLTKITNTSTQESPANLYPIGLFYLKKEELKCAYYAFKRYVSLFPNGENVESAKKYINQLLEKSVYQEEKKDDGLENQYQDGDVIFIENEPGEALHIIQKGKVKISKVVNQKESLLAILKTGDVFGEMALLEDKPRSATATAYGEVRTTSIKRDNFEIILKNRIQLVGKLISILSDRVWVTYKKLENIFISEPIGRVYDILLLIALQRKMPIVSSSYTYDVSKEEIAEMLGFNSPQEKEYLLKIAEDSNIKYEDGKFTVVSLEKLSETVKYYNKLNLKEMMRKSSKF